MGVVDVDMRAALVTNLLRPGDVAATSEDPEYPVDFILNEHPKLPWKAAPGVLEATLTVTVPGSCSAIYLGDFDAIRIDYALRNLAGEVLESRTYDFGSATDYYELIVGYRDDDPETQLWIDYPYHVGPHVLEFHFVSHERAGCGVVVANVPEVFPNPQWGLREMLVDVDPVRGQTNIGRYYKKGDIVREFSGTMKVNRDLDFYRMLYRIGGRIGEKPIPWKITEIPSPWMLVYAGFVDLPGGSHDSYRRSTITFRIRQAI